MTAKAASRSIKLIMVVGCLAIVVLTFLTRG